MQASQTQIDAFYSLSSEEKSDAKQRILDVFGGDHSVTLTNDEIAARANLGFSTVCARANEMVKDAVLAVRGKGKRPGKSRRQQLIGLPVGVPA